MAVEGEPDVTSNGATEAAEHSPALPTRRKPLCHRTAAGVGRAAPARTTLEASSQREMMRLVAQLYYVRELGQPDIATLTGFSISKVSRLLAAARAAGVVRISVEGAPSVPTPLARKLSEALGLEVWVTPGHETAPALAARLCGVAAAPRLADELPAEGAIGLTGGYTVESLVAALPSASRPMARGRAARRRLGFEQPPPQQQRDRPPHGRAHRGRRASAPRPGPARQ